MEEHLDYDYFVRPTFPNTNLAEGLRRLPGPEGEKRNSRAVYRAVENPNDITVLTSFARLKRREPLRNAELKNAMKNAGLAELQRLVLQQG